MTINQTTTKVIISTADGIDTIITATIAEALRFASNLENACGLARGSVEVFPATPISLRDTLEMPIIDDVFYVDGKYVSL